MNQSYQEELLDHYRHPRNEGALDSPDFSSEDDNPSCGDRVLIQGHLGDGRLTDLRFKAQGCVLSIASADILTEHCKGKSIEEVCALSSEDMMSLVGMQLGPNRVKCAVLCLFVLQEAIMAHTSMAHPKKIN